MKELLITLLAAAALAGCASQDESDSMGGMSSDAGVYPGQGTSGSPVGSTNAWGSSTGNTDSQITPATNGEP